MVSDIEGQNLYALLWGTPSNIHLGLEPAFPGKPIKMIKPKKSENQDKRIMDQGKVSWW